MRLTWQKETTIYYGEPYFQVMAQQEFSAPVIIITTNTLYELYLNVMPARILQEVSWYVLPATSSHATFQQLEELLGFVTEKEYPEVILLGFGPNSILQLTMSLAKMLASCQELWLFPQDQEGFLQSCIGESRLTYGTHFQVTRLMKKPQLIYFEEGIATTKELHLRQRQKDLLTLVSLGFLSDNTLLKDLFQNYPTQQRLSQIAPLSFVSEELAILKTQPNSVKQLRETLAQIRYAFFLQKNLSANEEGTVLLFYLYLAQQFAGYQIKLGHLQKWWQQLGIFPVSFAKEEWWELVSRLPQSYYLLNQESSLVTVALTPSTLLTAGEKFLKGSPDHEL